MLIPQCISDQKAPDYRRLLNALTLNGEPERVPFYELFIEQSMVERIMQVPYSIEAEVALYHNLCHDYVNFTPDSGLLQTSCLVAADTGENNKGGQREWLNSTDGLLSTREAYRRYPWKRLDDSCWQGYNDYLRHLPAGMKIVIRPLGVFENVRRLMGFEALSFALYDDEELIRDVFQHVGEAIYGSLKMLFDKADLNYAFACIMGDDLAAGKGTLVNPDVYRKHVFPWMKAIADLAHGKGMPFGWHSCGDNELIMEEMIADIGLNAKHSFQDNVIPVQEFKKKYGRRVCVLGGLDMDKLTSMPEQEFVAYARATLDVCKKGGGYALGTGNSPATYISLTNFLNMHKVGLGLL